MINEKPILFSGEMVRAILEGKKTQTRRVATKDPNAKGFYWAENIETFPSGTTYTGWVKNSAPSLLIPMKCPYGKVGDRLWVRETWVPDCATVEECRASFEDLMQGCSGPYYRATASDFDIETLRWKPSIHMPRWASRTSLEITDIRVERLQNICASDCLDEGIEDKWSHKYSVFPACVLDSIVDDYRTLWDSINGKPRADGIDISWSANPWVWVITFRRINNG